MSSELGTRKTAKARFWPWLSGTSPKLYPRHSLLARINGTLFTSAGLDNNHTMPKIDDNQTYDQKCVPISFRKSTPPQNRQLDIFTGNSKQSIDDFVGG